ncbi:hypothetical protein [Xanthomonas phage XacN1]|nr:hypothetical protein [Xanthomonas phage XacN1]
MNELPGYTPSEFLFYPNENDLYPIRREWNMILEHYGEGRAKRSQVPFINHIIEGLAILRYIDASTQAKAAFCIHPIIQADADLVENFDWVRKTVGGDVLMLAMEYRSVANEYLSHRNVFSLNEIRLSPLKDVNDMLIADKVQNYKDFILYHHGTHPRSNELHEYFKNWLDRLECRDVMDEYFPGWQSYATV